MEWVKEVYNISEGNDRCECALSSQTLLISTYSSHIPYIDIWAKYTSMLILVTVRKMMTQTFAKAHRWDYSTEYVNSTIVLVLHINVEIQFLEPTHCHPAIGSRRKLITHINKHEGYRRSKKVRTKLSFVGIFFALSSDTKSKTVQINDRVDQSRELCMLRCWDARC